MKRHVACIVLNHLLHGGKSFKVTFKNETAPRTFVFDDQDSLCELRVAEHEDGTKREILLRFDLGLGDFVKLCEENVSESDAFLIGAETAMIEMAQERILAREKRAAR